MYLRLTCRMEKVSLKTLGTLNCPSFGAPADVQFKVICSSYLFFLRIAKKVRSMVSLDYK